MRVTPRYLRRRGSVPFMSPVCRPVSPYRHSQNCCIHTVLRCPVQAGAYTAAMPMTDLDPGIVENLSQRLVGHGVRPTAQRLRIASVLLGRPQHLSAEQVLAGLRNQGLRVSKATIYNTLNLFAASGLIRQLSVGNDRCWFDSNTDAHYHFHDLDTGALMDVSLRDVEFQRLPEPPPGMQVDGIDLVIRLRRKSAA
jgi:Fur family transcriptional regulator, iron response regulator